VSLKRYDKPARSASYATSVNASVTRSV
jgi:hypothetical protein